MATSLWSAHPYALRLLGLCLAAGLAAPAHAGSSIGLVDSQAPTRTENVVVTPGGLQDLIAEPGTEVERVTEAEARARAAEAGVELPVLESRGARTDWDKPWFIVKAGLGLPGNVAAQVEVYVHPQITVEGGVGTGLLGHTFMAAVRWRPDATCWGCHGKNLFSIGFGVEAHGIVVDRDFGSAILVGSVDAHYIHRFAEHFGFVLGLKAGVGPTVDIRDNGLSKVEPSLVLLLYTGFSF